MAWLHDTCIVVWWLWDCGWQGLAHTCTLSGLIVENKPDLHEDVVAPNALELEHDGPDRGMVAVWYVHL